MSERKFKIGDVVKPIKTDPDSHDFEEWEILTITRVSDGDPNLFECTRESDGNWDLLWGFELELVEGDKTYTHEEVAEILGIEKDQVETIAVDISDKPFEDKEVDMVNHPPHYANKEPETIKMIEAILPPLEFIGGLKWQILKYRDRAGDKWDKEEDLKKAKFYYDYLEEYKARKGIE